MQLHAQVARINILPGLKPEVSNLLMRIQSGFADESPNKRLEER